MPARLQSTMFLLICWTFANIALGTNGQSAQKKWDINITTTINSSKLYYLHDLIKTIYNKNPTGLELGETCNEAMILFDSTGDTIDAGVIAQDDEPAYDQYDTYMADDFGVDVCDWIITGVVNIGGIEKRSVTFPKWNVIVYDMSGTGGFPGNVIDERLGLTNFNIMHPNPDPGSVLAEVMIVIDPPIKVDTGDYWLSVQADMAYSVGGTWFWATSLNPRDNTLIWKENGGFGTGCTEWNFPENCGGTPVVTALFSLIGCRGPDTCNPTNAPSLSPTQAPSSSPSISPTISPIESSDSIELNQKHSSSSNNKAPPISDSDGDGDSDDSDESILYSSKSDNNDDENDTTDETYTINISLLISNTPNILWLIIVFIILVFIGILYWIYVSKRNNKTKACVESDESDIDESKI